jgi:hypothetical protein
MEIMADPVYKGVSAGVYGKRRRRKESARTHDAQAAPLRAAKKRIGQFSHLKRTGAGTVTHNLFPGVQQAGMR